MPFRTCDRRAMSIAAPTETLEILQAWGMPKDAWIGLESGPAAVKYSDLAFGRRGEAALVDGVVEVDGRPLLYVRTRSTSEVELARLYRDIAVRSDGAFIAVHLPGRLSVYKPTLAEAGPEGPVRTLEAQSAQPGWLLELASSGRQPREQLGRNFLLHLLSDVTATLANCGLTSAAAFSLAGRALFLRFLADRGILPDTLVPKIAPGCTTASALFDTAHHAELACKWMDTTFNGGLLPLELPGGLGGLPREALARVADILRKAPRGQLVLPLDWSGLDFAHIPVGLLSEVYEAHAAQHEPAARRTESIHYTPCHVADFMVRQSIRALPDPASARVLDPAAGAGVFLVAAYRELVARRWERDGVRPARPVLREILRNQLVGFDINQGALGLAMLALYLTALELDPEPSPLEELRFDRLHGASLVHVRTPGSEGAVDPGSLGAAIGPEHESAYDLVVGNPPWTSWPGRVPESVKSGLARVYAGRMGSGSPSFKDKTPDLWFLWRAMGWCRPGGRIALALHARWLFQHNEDGCRARNDILTALRVTGILNGSALRNTKYWPNVTAPFSILFAHNEPGLEDAAFWFVSPTFDPELNALGQLRVDADGTSVGTPRQVREDPYWFKAHFRGTARDVELLLRLLKRAPALQHWWTQVLGLHESHQGFKRGGTPQQSAAAFEGLPVLEASDRQVRPFFTVDVQAMGLRPQSETTLHRTRTLDIYQPPLVIVPARQSKDRAEGRAARSDVPVMYCQSYYGWSTAKAPRPEELAAYLQLVMHCEVLRFVSLLTSSQYGVERDVLLGEDIEAWPVPALDDLPAEVRQRIPFLASGFAKGVPDWPALDSWAGEVFQLSRWDQQAIVDALHTAAPEVAFDARASVPPQDREQWCEAVVDVLDAALRAFGRTPRWRERPIPGVNTWVVLELCTSDTEEASAPADVRRLLEHADDYGATELVCRTANGLLVARVNQARLWTVTRGRACAARWLQEHGDHLAGIA